MNEFFKTIFGTTKGPAEITLFSIWHILWIVLILGCSIGAYFLLRHKSEKAKNITLSVLAYLAIGFYIMDFFIMPFSEGEINIDKLPFHICTLTAVFIPFAQFNKKFKPVRNVITCFAIVASLMYITYPGSALGGVTPWCYKVVETFLFHGFVFAWGFLSVALKAVEFNFKEIWKEAVGIVLIIIWAFFGNYAYLGIPNGHHYDWFFITGSTFPFIPSWLMPFCVFVAVYGMCALIYLIDFVIKKIVANHQKKKELAAVTVGHEKVAAETLEKSDEKQETVKKKAASKNKTNKKA